MILPIPCKRFNIYMDNCCFNRPYDDQGNERIRLETEAKMYVQDLIKLGTVGLAWSFILDFENNANPIVEQKKAIAQWKVIADSYVKANHTIRIMANDIHNQTKLKSKDSLHIASAIFIKSDYLLTTDKKMLKAGINQIKIINPVDFVLILHEEN